MLEINKGICRPELRLQFFASDDLAWTLQQQEENFEGLSVKLEVNSVLVNAPRTWIHAKVAEVKNGQNSTVESTAPGRPKAIGY